MSGSPQKILELGSTDFRTILTPEQGCLTWKSTSEQGWCRAILWLFGALSAGSEARIGSFATAFHSGLTSDWFLSFEILWSLDVIWPLISVLWACLGDDLVPRSRYDSVLFCFQFSKESAYHQSWTNNRKTIWIVYSMLWKTEVDSWFPGPFLLWEDFDSWLWERSGRCPGLPEIFGGL